MNKKIEIPTEEYCEKMILGRMFNSINAANLCIEKLDSEDFFHPVNQEIFQYMKILYDKDKIIEINLIYTEMIHHGKVVKLDFLINLAQEGWSNTQDDEYYIDLLKSASNKRKLLHLSNEMLVKCGDRKFSPQEIYDEFHSKADLIFNSTRNKSYFKISEILDGKHEEGAIPYMKWVENRQKMALAGVSMIEGYETTYPILDEALDGLNKGHFIIVGARPGVGKTTFILNIIHRLLSCKNYKLGFFSLEMSAMQLVKKLSAIQTGINSVKISKGDTVGRPFQEIYEADRTLHGKELYVDDQAGLKISQLCSRAKRMKASHDIDILFIDYLTQIQGDGKHPNKQAEIQEVSNRLRILAKDLQIPIVCIAQLNRESEKEDRIPRKSDLRESGQIEQDAHSILLLHSPSQDDKYDQPGKLCVYIVKNRFGEQKKIDFQFNLQNGNIEELKNIKELIEDKNSEDYENLDNHLRG
jgi:replicative DNA helicase